MMEMIKLGLIIMLLLSNVFSQELDGENWREGIEEARWPNTEVIRDVLLEMTGKPKHQHLSVKGKTGCRKMQTARKRHKFQTFVGLMGKRSSDYRGAL